MSQNLTPASVLQLLESMHIDAHDEGVAQRQINDHLLSFGVTFRREYSLGSAGVIDFYFPLSRIGLEVKAAKAATRKNVFRQVERYAAHESIASLILATGRAQGLPPRIAGKPVFVYPLGRKGLL